MKKKISQWFLKISKYSEELLDDLNKLNKWPNKVKVMQSDWIGKSVGAEIDFKIKKNKPDSIKIFTTRPDTIYGATFIAISPEHKITQELSLNNKSMKKFIEECRNINPDKIKKGFNTSLVAEHPFISNKTIPIFVANFVLTEYGLGAIFGCPAHDQRDLDFAREYKIDVIPVVKPEYFAENNFTVDKEAFTDNGVMINSDVLNGLKTNDAKEKIIDVIVEKKKLAAKKSTISLEIGGYPDRDSGVVNTCDL